MANKTCVKCGGTDFNNSGHCRACVKARNAAWYAANTAKRAEYKRSYREQHPERVAEIKKAHYDKNAEVIRAKRRASYHEQPEKEKALVRAWIAANPDKVAAYRTAYLAENKPQIEARRKRWYAANAELIRERSRSFYAQNFDRYAKYREENKSALAERCRSWAQRNMDRLLIYAANRRAKVRAGGNLSHGIRQRLYQEQKGLCACCGLPLGEKYHLDHIMPLALGGTNTDDNVQLLRARCNISKGAKHPDDFMRMRRAQHG